MKIIRVTALWCMSCLAMKRTWNKVFKEFKNIDIIDYDYDFNKEEVAKLDIGEILPVLILYKHDVEVKRLIGETSKKALKEALEVLYEED